MKNILYRLDSVKKLVEHLKWEINKHTFNKSMNKKSQSKEFTPLELHYNTLYSIIQTIKTNKKTMTPKFQISFLCTTCIECVCITLFQPLEMISKHDLGARNAFLHFRQFSHKGHKSQSEIDSDYAEI